MSGYGTRGFGRMGLLVAGLAALGVAAPAGARAVLAEVVSVDVVSAPSPRATASMDLALRSALAHEVPPADAARPWRVEYGSVALALAMPNQQAASWCWAATAVAVATYYGAPLSQCDVVAAASPAGRLTGGCPDVPGSSGQQAQALLAAGIPAEVVDRPLTAAESRAQIAAGRPVIAFLGATTGTVGHMVLIRGHDTAGGLLIADPVADRADAALAWHSRPDQGVPYSALVPRDGRDGSVVPLGSVATGQGQDGSTLWRTPAPWLASVIVAPPGQRPSLAPQPSALRAAAEARTPAAVALDIHPDLAGAGGRRV